MITNINIIFKEILSLKLLFNIDKKQGSQFSSTISSSFFNFLLAQRQGNVIIHL